MNNEVKLVNILGSNSGLLVKWLHEISASSVPVFNSSSGRFLKSKLNLDLLEKLICNEGWFKSDGTEVDNFIDAEIVDCDLVDSGYNLSIEGITFSFRGQDKSVTKQGIIVQNIFTKDADLKAYDYLFLYSPAFSDKDFGAIGILDFETVKNSSVRKKFGFVLNTPKEVSEYTWFLKVKPKYKVLTLGEGEIQRLYKKFRNDVCDIISVA